MSQPKSTKGKDSAPKMTDIEKELAHHDELFSMLSGTRKWDGIRVAEGLRSKHLSKFGRKLALAQLADLIDGTATCGSHLKLTGSGKRIHIADSFDEYEKTMEIGRWIEQELDQGETFRSALAGAEDEFGVSESTAQRAVKVYRKRIKRADETGLWYPLPPVRKR